MPPRKSANRGAQACWESWSSGSSFSGYWTDSSFPDGLRRHRDPRCCHPQRPIGIFRRGYRENERSMASLTRHSNLPIHHSRRTHCHGRRDPGLRNPLHWQRRHRAPVQGSSGRVHPVFEHQRASARRDPPRRWRGVRLPPPVSAQHQRQPPNQFALMGGEWQQRPEPRLPDPQGGGVLKLASVRRHTDWCRWRSPCCRTFRPRHCH